MATNKSALNAWRNKYVNPVTGGAFRSAGETGLSAGGSALDAWKEKYVSPVTTPKETAKLPAAPENSIKPTVEPGGTGARSFETIKAELEAAQKAEKSALDAANQYVVDNMGWLDMKDPAELQALNDAATTATKRREELEKEYYSHSGSYEDKVGDLGDFGKAAATVISKPFLAVDVAAETAKNAVQGNETQSDSVAMQKYGQMLKAREDALSETSRAGRFLAETGLSIADNLYGRMLGMGTKFGTGLITGVSSAADKMYQLNDQGESAGRSLMRGAISGGIEGAAEALSVGNLLKLMKKDGAKTVAGFLAKQAGFEASEEGVTYIANYIADKAFKDPNAKFSLVELMEAVGQGGLSGLIFGAGGYATNRVKGGAIPGSGLDGTPAAQDGVIPVENRTVTQTTPNATEQTETMPGMDTGGQFEAVEGEKNAPANAETAEQSEETRKKERLSRAKNLLEFTGITMDVDDDTIAMAQRLSDVTGREILFYRSDKGENGYYSKEDQTIWVNAGSENPVAQIISHELTHSVEFAGAYNELSALVQLRIAKSGADVEQMLQDKKAQYSEWGKELDDRGAMQEVVAEYISKNLLTDEAAITEMARNNPTLVQRIKTFLDNLWQALQTKVGLTGTKAQERAEIRRMLDAYTRALQQAGAGYGVSTDTTMERMSSEYAADALTEEDFDDTVDVVMEEESTAGKSMVEGDPLSRQTSGGGAQYSIANTRHMQWGKQVRSYFSGDKTIKSSDSLYLGESAVDGVQNSPRYVPTSVITKAVRTPKGSRSAHALTEADIMKLEEGINNAPVVIHNPTRNAIVYMTANQDSAGNYIVAAFDLNNDLYGENAHKATSIHGHQNLAGLLENLGEDATVFVKNENKLNQMLPGNQILKSLELLAKVELDDGSVAQNAPAVKMVEQGIIPVENRKQSKGQYSFTGTPEDGRIPVDEGYWNSIMEQGRIPFMESDQPGYSEALLEEAEKQNPFAGRGRELDPMEGIIPNADTVQRTKTEEPSVEIDNLPTKAANTLKRAENAMLKALGEKMSVPGVAQRDYLKPIVRQISEEYLHTGDVSQEKANALFTEAWKQGLEVDSEFYEENKYIKDYLRTTKITVGDDIKADFADWSSWRQRAFGSLRMVDSGGLGVDTAYQELNGMNPGLFPDSITTTSDQLQRMYDVAKSIRQVETTLEAAHAGDTVYEQWAQQQFEDALAKMRLELRNVKRFTLDRAEQLAREETTDLTLDDVKALYPKLKDARRQYERAQAKNLLTAGDSAMVNRILRGDAELEGLDPEKYNVSGIRAVYEAKQEYENYASQIRKWNQARKAELRKKADTFLRTANAWKDKSKGILYSRETMERNIRDIVPDDQLADQVVREYFAPVHDAVADATRTKNEYRDRVRALNLSTKISKADAADGKVSEAHAVQLLGEAQDSIRMLERAKGRMKERDGKTLKDWKAVVENLWANNPQLDQAKIEGAVEEFRKIYDELFTKMNETRVRNGYEPVNYRSGYFPHFQPGDGDGVLVQFGKALGIDTAVSALPTNINGLSHTFKPGITWMGNAQERLGFNTVYDAVEGFDKYIEGVADVIHLTDSIQNLRAFASQMRYRTTEQGIRDQVDTIRSDERLTAQEKEDAIQNLYNDPKTKYVLGNFVVELDEYINLLANKKSRADRNMEQALGRDAYNVVKALESRVAANMVAINPASWLTNFIPLTQGWAGVTSKHLLRGMQDTLKSVKADDGIVEQSSFLTNRRGSDPLVQTWAQKASETASKPMEYIDNFTAGSLVRARYYQNIERGMSEVAAMDEADSWVAGVMADRSKGATPTLFNRSNPITKLFTQFQLEVNNQLGYVFKDIPRDMKDKGVAALAGALLKFALGAFLFDEIYEYFIGRRPALDPIGILNDTVGDITGYELPNLVEGTVRAAQGGEFFDEVETADNWWSRVGQAAGNLTANVAGELPFTAVLSPVASQFDIEFDQGRIPVASALPSLSTVGGALFNSEWSGKKRVKEGLEELAKPGYYLAPPFGGGQLKKIVEGTAAAIQGGSYTLDSDGNAQLQYPVYGETTGEKLWNGVRASVFGKTSLPTGQDWIESGFPTLSAEETQAYQNMTDAGISGEDAWGWLLLMKEADGTIGKLTAIGESGAPNEAAQELFGVVLGTEMVTEAGNPTQYAKLLAAMEEGLTAAEYVVYRQAVYKLTKKEDKLEALQAAGFTAAEAERLLEQLG